MMQQQRTRAAVLLLLGLGLLASCLTQAFLVPMPLSMRVGRSTNTQRSKSVGILNSMRENINSQANPNQVGGCGGMSGWLWIDGRGQIEDRDGGGC